MKIISHRGNINGRNAQKENTLKQIIKCIEMGYDVEVDIRRRGNKFYLGHDKEDMIIEENQLFELSEKLWIHCKDLNSLSWFVGTNNNLFNFFWHEKDQYTLTSKGYIWSYPGSKLTENCILVLPEWNFDKEKLNLISKRNNFYGICTDYPNLFEK